MILIVISYRFFQFVRQYYHRKKKKDDNKMIRFLLTSYPLHPRIFFCITVKKKFFMLVIRQVFPILINKNNEETDHFEEAFFPRQQQKRLLFAHECVQSKLFLAISLDTSLTESIFLSTLQWLVY